MRPEDTQSQPEPAQQPSASAQAAAANIVREQVNAAYGQAETMPDNNPYQRTHVAHVDTSAEQWKQYHSAWQDYYQKYYERYYTAHAHHVHQTYSQHFEQQQAKLEAEKQRIVAENQPDAMSQDEALYELHNQLLGKVKETSAKVRKSRHFVPIAAAVCVMLVFAFLQYNQLLIANVKAYVSPGSINPQNIIVDPITSTSVDPALTNLIIPKINVDVPVDYKAKPDYDSQMASMKNGVAYFGIPGANSKPGQIGNTPIAGHSSNDVLAAGDYKFIFAQLEKVKKGDTVYANYKGTRYTYTVIRTEVVLPSEVNRLVYKTDKPMLTLITCTPLGTAQKRLLVTAEQVNPSPDSAEEPADDGSTGSSTTQMVGTEPTFFERLFGAH